MSSTGHRYLFWDARAHPVSHCGAPEVVNESFSGNTGPLASPIPCLGKRLRSLPLIREVTGAQSLVVQRANEAVNREIDSLRTLHRSTGGSLIGGGSLLGGGSSIGGISVGGSSIGGLPGGSIGGGSPGGSSGGWGSAASK